MAHQITVRENGFAEFAFTGERSQIWHGLGNRIENESDFEEWSEKSGMDWTIETTPVIYRAGGDIRQADDRHVLYRSDNQNEIGIVSSRFKVVQPQQVLDFFQEVCQRNNMSMSTAGTLFGGRRFWGLATVESQDVIEGDTLNNHILLMTGTDGKFPTIARHTSIRVVCNNTLTVALQEEEGKNPLVRVKHSSHFDPKQVMLDMDLVHERFANFMDELKQLASIPMTDAQKFDFIESHVRQERKVHPEDELNSWAQKQVDDIVNATFNGAGNQYAPQTAYSMLQGMTNYYTHGGENTRKSASKLFDSGFNGEFSLKKVALKNQLLQLA